MYKTNLVHLLIHCTNWTYCAFLKSWIKSKLYIDPSFWSHQGQKPWCRTSGILVYCSSAINVESDCPTKTAWSTWDVLCQSHNVLCFSWSMLSIRAIKQFIPKLWSEYIKVLLRSLSSSPFDNPIFSFCQFGEQWSFHSALLPLYLAAIFMNL